VITGAELYDGRRPIAAHISVYLFAVVPFIALLAVIPIAWGWGLTWLDLGLAAACYTVTCLGVTVGFHRYFTHSAFKARRWLRVTMAIVGSMAVQGPILHWVADHRRHHAFSDRDGDPHSPWTFGSSPAALARGFWHAHMGWIFERDLTNQRRFAPDLLADRDIRIVHRLFGLCTAITMLAPALIAGLEAARRGARHQRGQRHAAAERLAERQDVGAHASVLEAIEPARAADAGLDLVEDQQHAPRLR